MTKEEKQELLISLCSMLPYKVMVRTSVSVKPLTCEILSNIIEEKNNFIILPYLRPMSSMTEEEENEFISLNTVPSPCQLPNHTRMSWYSNATMLDWLNEHHFDYRNLIRKGLALEAPEGMYKIK